MAFKLLTTEEAAARARISPRFLQMQIARGTGPVVTRIGRRVLFRTDALQEWFEHHTQKQGDVAHPENV